MKRATGSQDSIFAFRAISIHALVKRATPIKAVGNSKILNFNPRPREEGDFRIGNAIRKYDISIHALVKRATATSGALRKRQSISIHALVKRATYANFVEFVEIFYFNPRPREEGD